MVHTSHVRNRCADRFSAVGPQMRRAVSLLEVVLSLAVLAVATAYLAQSMQLATENALRAESLTQAEIVAESVMNQIVAGIIPAQTSSWSSYIPPSSMTSGLSMAAGTQWLYQVQSVGAEVPGMVGIQVAVQQVRLDQSLSNQPDLLIQRWIVDPNLGLDTPSNPAAIGSLGGLP
ncbi:MAG: hypothetical protein KF752_03370 [Pirellulaceae bacterium]|nr:hypothetical protein [Pirellulaceae bacterium]